MGILEFFLLPSTKEGWRENCARREEVVGREEWELSDSG
jgi:hypothetical protein